MKFEIKSRSSGAVLFSIETDSWKLAVEAAVKAGANLSRANLSGADLYGADLYGAKNADLVVAQTLIVPADGPIHGWKKCRDKVLVKVAVGAKAKRSNASGRKCRAEYVKVLEVIGAEEGISFYDGETKYRVGQIVRCKAWDDNRWNECSGGIHFFLTRQEAEAWEG